MIDGREAPARTYDFPMTKWLVPGVATVLAAAAAVIVWQVTNSSGPHKFHSPVDAVIAVCGADPILRDALPGDLLDPRWIGTYNRNNGTNSIPIRWASNAQHRTGTAVVRKTVGETWTVQTCKVRRRS